MTPQKCTSNQLPLTADVISLAKGDRELATLAMRLGAQNALQSTRLDLEEREAHFGAGGPTEHEVRMCLETIEEHWKGAMTRPTSNNAVGALATPVTGPVALSENDAALAVAVAAFRVGVRRALLGVASSLEWKQRANHGTRATLGEVLASVTEVEGDVTGRVASSVFSEIQRELTDGAQTGYFGLAGSSAMVQ